MVELWDADGVLLRTYEREVDWFQPWEDNWPPWSSPPRPSVEALHRGENGLLWLMVLVPDPAWRKIEPTIRSPTAPDPVGWPRSTYDLWYDTLIEIWSPETGQLVASHVSDMRLRGFLHGG